MMTLVAWPSTYEGLNHNIFTGTGEVIWGISISCICYVFNEWSKRSCDKRLLPNVRDKV